jgi:hypothetical protein
MANLFECCERKPLEQPSLKQSACFPHLAKEPAYGKAENAFRRYGGGKGKGIRKAAN